MVFFLLANSISAAFARISVRGHCRTSTTLMKIHHRLRLAQIGADVTRFPFPRT